MQIEHRHTLRKQNGASSKKSVAVAFLPGKNHSNQQSGKQTDFMQVQTDRHSGKQTDSGRQTNRQINTNDIQTERSTLANI